MLKINKNILVPAILLMIFAVVAGAAYFVNARSGDKILKPDEAAKKAVDFANANMLDAASKAEFVSAKEENGLYTFKLKVGGQEYESYVTKNGKMFFVQGVKIEDATTTVSADDSKTAATEVSKSDKPDVKLFIMTYCPYGLQAQKMYLPVYDLLKNKADMGIYFVNYAMHGKAEVDENLLQYCLQKEQSDKYPAYLKCFVNGAQAESAKCLTSTGVDKAKLAVCVAAADKQFAVTDNFNDKTKWASGQFPKFLVNDDLNVKYGVAGSPTVVINGVEASPSSRSPEAFKELICSAFNTAPEECKTTLSADQPKTSFGSGTAAAGASSDSGCATPAQ